MGVIRVEHNENYTTMSNYHLRDRRLSLRAMGLMSKMLSLPDDWDYTVSGLSFICKEGRDAVRKALMELEEAGYLVRKQARTGGCFANNDYTLFEQPMTSPLTENPSTGNPSTENPSTVNPTTEKSSTENPLTETPSAGNPTQLNNEYTKVLTKEKKDKERKERLSLPSWMAADVMKAIVDYCGDDAEMLAAWMDYAQTRHRIGRPVATVATVKRSCSTLDKYSKGNRAYKLGMLRTAADKAWRGLFALKPGDEGYPENPTAVEDEEEGECLN